MINSSLCGYSDAYILVKGTMTATGGNADAERKADERHKELIFKNCAPFTQSISQVNNTQADNAKDVNLVVLIYYLIKYAIIIQKHLKGNIVDFRGNSASFR